MTPSRTNRFFSAARGRLVAEHGFTMTIALGVLVVTSLLVAGAYAAVRTDTKLTQRDLDSKNAYYAARAAVHRFLSDLNRNPNLWQTCPTQPTPAPIAPGSQQKYTYEPVPAPGQGSCSTTDPITSMIHYESGTFRMRFVGYAGNPEVKRGLIASFRKDTPLDYLWYTIYETLDPLTYDDPTWAETNCKKFKYQGRTSPCTDIVWVTNDDVRGPAYTQDQYMINGGGAPVFGRSGTTDEIASSAPGTNPQDICTSSNCQGAQYPSNNRVIDADVISPPPDNDKLRVDAASFGNAIYTGLTKIQLNGTTATITRCPATGCLAPFDITIDRHPLGKPIIYLQNGSGCSSSYRPYNPQYPSSMVPGGTAPATSNCGIAYVSGNYSRSLTIAAADDIVVSGNITRSGPPDSAAALGLVGNKFVRVMHGVTPRPVDKNNCGSPAATNITNQTMTDPIIEAAILAIQHSFIVDNYDCGAKLNELTVTGAIAQFYRGTVGTVGGTGYFKDYNYDDRFTVAQPPYLFDIASSNWRIDRETLCVPGGSAPSTAC